MILSRGGRRTEVNLTAIDDIIKPISPTTLAI